MQPEGQREQRRLGEALRRERERLPGKVSQEDFAELCDLHRTYIGQVERGERNLSFVSLLRITKALKLRPSALLERAGL
jgi:transcriptional regulator with XRE-family HTH domain